MIYQADFSIRCGDEIQFAGEDYVVSGIYLGAEGKINLIGIVCAPEIRGSADGRTVHEMLVPETVLRAAIKLPSAKLWRRVDTCGRE